MVSVPTLAHESSTTVHGFDISVETLRSWNDRSRSMDSSRQAPETPVSASLQPGLLW